MFPHCGFRRRKTACLAALISTLQAAKRHTMGNSCGLYCGNTGTLVFCPFGPRAGQPSGCIFSSAVRPVGAPLRGITGRRSAAEKPARPSVSEGGFHAARQRRLRHSRVLCAAQDWATHGLPRAAVRPLFGRHGADRRSRAWPVLFLMGTRFAAYAAAVIGFCAANGRLMRVQPVWLLMAACAPSGHVPGFSPESVLYISSGP